MPCNAVARADASVNNQTLAKLLTPQVISKVVPAWLKEKFGTDLNIQPQERGDTIAFYVRSYVIWIQNGNVSVTQGYYSSDNRQLAQALTDYLSKVAGVLFQNVVKQALARKFAIESTVTAPNGAQVITLEV